MKGKQKAKIVKVWNPGALTLLNPNKEGQSMRKRKNFFGAAKKPKRKNPEIPRRYKRRPNPAPLGVTFQNAVGLTAGMAATEVITRFIPFGKDNWLIQGILKVVGAYLLSIGAEKVAFLKPYANGISIAGPALLLKDIMQRFFPNFSMPGMETGRLRPMRRGAPRQPALPSPAMVPVVGPPPGTTPVAVPALPVATTNAAPLADYYVDAAGNLYQSGMSDFYEDEFDEMSGMDWTDADNAYNSQFGDLVTNFPYANPGGLGDLVTNWQP